MSKIKHPGKTPAQRRALDQIGCGNHSPIMSKATRDALVKAGLIFHVCDKIIGSPPLTMRVAVYDMPIPIHMAWCDAVASEGGDDAI